MQLRRKKNRKNIEETLRQIQSPLMVARQNLSLTLQVKMIVKRVRSIVSLLGITRNPQKMIAITKIVREGVDQDHEC
jgi:hypothetical protein